MMRGEEWAGSVWANRQTGRPRITRPQAQVRITTPDREIGFITPSEIRLTQKNFKINRFINDFIVVLSSNLCYKAVIVNDSYVANWQTKTAGVHAH
jgi:hypothetical protein